MRVIELKKTFEKTEINQLYGYENTERGRGAGRRLNIRNNQTPRRIVFDSENFEISNRAPRRVNPRFKESNINYEVSFKELPNDHQMLQDIFYGCIDKLINLSFSENPNSMTRITIYHEDGISHQPPE